MREAEFCLGLLYSIWHSLKSVQGVMKSQDYQDILEPNVLLRVRKLGLSHPLDAFQQDNDNQLKNTQEQLF